MREVKLREFQCVDQLSVVLCSEVVLGGGATAGVQEEELTPLEVLTELCWMASFWGLPGTDISSQLSSFSKM